MLESLDAYREAALLVATGGLADHEVTARLGLMPAELARARGRHAFGALVEQARLGLWLEVQDGLLSPLARRLALRWRWEDLVDVQRARAEYGAERLAALGPAEVPEAAQHGRMVPHVEVRRAGTSEHWSLNDDVVRELLALDELAARYEGDPNFGCRACTTPERAMGRDPRMPAPRSLERLVALNELWFALREMVRKRGEDAAQARADPRRPIPPPPGAETGLLACELRAGRRGLHERWRLDRSTLRALRALEAAGARSRGESGFVCRCRGRRALAIEAATTRPPSLPSARGQLVEIGRRLGREFAVEWDRWAA